MAKQKAKKPAKAPATTDITGPHPGRTVMIDDLIGELQRIRERFGNTTCFVSGLVWGSVALWHRSWKDEYADLKDSAADLLAACRAKLSAIEGKEYDPDALDEAVKLCRAAIAREEARK